MLNSDFRYIPHFIYFFNCDNLFFAVDEPCELGCDGLSFCTNFNNRPTELFRSCNANADRAAQADVDLWRERVSILYLKYMVKIEVHKIHLTTISNNHFRVL